MSNRNYFAEEESGPARVSSASLVARLGLPLDGQPASPPVTIFERLRRALAVRRQRQMLLTLDEHQLKDIGLSRADAEGEAGRRLLDLPGRPFRYY
jgi:uncharacterized protein YjiS (DUF1127 family)